MGEILLTFKLQNSPQFHNALFTVVYQNGIR